eukprot:TRINITY_DN9354_c0_g1_i1.p1 TRINITY_DN9354_c0_g1~~TRINITY_DN9354_c0_g1_i1.p1  ORF type:complete len:105 (+),score=6.66 TRINITY_DN9354_c0_g1_i1:18-332(+)
MAMIVLSPLLMMGTSFGCNVPLGQYRRCHTERFSWQWFVAVHGSVPALIVVRRVLGLGRAYIPLSIGAAVAGQWLGGEVGCGGSGGKPQSFAKVITHYTQQWQK